MKAKFTQEYLERAHDHVYLNADECNRSTSCRCFYCGYSFPPSEIDYVNSWFEPETASCPMCQIDAVIGDASGYPVNDGEFVVAASEFFFDGISRISDGRPIVRLKIIGLEVE